MSVLNFKNNWSIAEILTNYQQNPTTCSFDINVSGLKLLTAPFSSLEPHCNNSSSKEEVRVSFVVTLAQEQEYHCGSVYSVPTCWLPSVWYVEERLVGPRPDDTCSAPALTTQQLNSRFPFPVSSLLCFSFLLVCRQTIAHFRDPQSLSPGGQKYEAVREDRTTEQLNTVGLPVSFY